MITRFNASVFCQMVDLLFLTHLVQGQSQVMGQPQPLVAMAGNDVVLPCQLEPAVDAISLTVEWARADLKPRFVLLRRGGVNLLIDQNPSYIGRASVSINKLKHGDLSLTLTKVKLSDAGTYRCIVPQQETISEVKLTVGLVSSPVLRLSRLSSGGTKVLLECESTGWYPEPEVFWLDGEGNLLSAGPPETVRGRDDLYTVSSRVTVELRHSNNVICRITQKSINQTRETQIYIPDDLFLAPSCSVGRIMIVLAAGFMCILALALGVFIMQHQKNKTKMLHCDATELEELQRPTAAEGESSYLYTAKEKKADLYRSIEDLDEALEKNEGELTTVIDSLRELKCNLKKQKESVNEILMEMIEKRTTIDEKDKKKKGEGKAAKVKRRKATRKDILQNADEMMETTENIIVTMSEMRVRLENNQKQVNKQLMETKKLYLDQRSPTERQ